jgi:putative SOS response-associated peptidase YedK
VLPPEAWDRWLDKGVADVADLLVPAPDDLLVRTKVSTKVNSVRNDGPELLEPVPD